MYRGGSDGDVDRGLAVHGVHAAASQGRLKIDGVLIM